MGPHDLKEIEGEGSRLWCKVCLQSWRKAPGSVCPGLPLYRWKDAPGHLKTRKQLKALHLKPGDLARGLILGKDGARYELFNQLEAVPTRPVTVAQAAALARGREHAGKRQCSRCKEWVSRAYFYRRSTVCEMCKERADEMAIRKSFEDARDEAISWARARLAESCVILDTETTGLWDAEIVQIAVIDLSGAVLVNSLVHPNGPIPADATAIHGITDEMVAGAPTWAYVHPVLVQAVQGHRIIAYNAEFDYAVLHHVCSIAGLPGFAAWEWSCAMKIYSKYYGEWSDYRRDWRWQALRGGDHTALGDCLAVLALIKRMANDKRSDEVENVE